MRVVITEDIISRALNESIEEFILEEEEQQRQSAWQSLKGSTLGKVGKGLWNGLKMYMDYRTNGQWNQKYNQFVKGKGAAIGSYYADKWFKKHFKRVQDIMYGDYYGDRTYFHTNLNGYDCNFSHDWKTGTYTLYNRYNDTTYSLKLDNYDNINTATKQDVNGNTINGTSTYNHTDGSFEVRFADGEGPMKIFKGEDNSTPESYIGKYCTANDFIQFTRNTLEDGPMKTAITIYIDRVIQAENNKNIKLLQQNPNDKIDHDGILNSITLAAFYTWYAKNMQNIPKSDNNNNNTNSQPTNSQAQQAANSTQGAQSYYANKDEVPTATDENRRRRRAF